MSHNKLHTAIIGLGNIGQRHLKIAQSHPSINLKAVCDQDPNKKSTLSANLQAYFYQNHLELLEKEALDLIIVCTPHYNHAQIAIDCMLKGCNVVVEKPMCLTLQEGQKMIDTATQTNQKLFVVKQNRFNLPVQKLKQSIDQGLLGEIYQVQCNVFWNRNKAYYEQSDWRGKKQLEAGALFTQGSHFVDLLIYLFGMPSNAKTVLKNRVHDIEFEDNGISILEFDNHMIASLCWSNNVYEKNYEGSLTVIAEKGTVKISGKYLNQLSFYNVKGDQASLDEHSFDRPNTYSQNYQGSSSNHHLVLDAVIQDIFNAQSQVVSGKEALKTVQAIHLIYNSI